MIEMDKLTQLVSAQDAATDLVSVPYPLNGISRLSIQVEFSDDSIEGTLYLQGTNNPAALTDTDPLSPSWPTIEDSDQSVTAGAGHMWNISSAQYKFLRMVWEASAGTGTLTAYMDVKFTEG